MSARFGQRMRRARRAACRMRQDAVQRFATTARPFCGARRRGFDSGRPQPERCPAVALANESPPRRWPAASGEPRSVGRAGPAGLEISRTRVSSLRAFARPRPVFRGRFSGRPQPSSPPDSRTPRPSVASPSATLHPKTSFGVRESGGFSDRRILGLRDLPAPSATLHPEARLRVQGRRR
jgi:hypothetical protein